MSSTVRQAIVSHMSANQRLRRGHIIGRILKVKLFAMLKRKIDKDVRAD